MPAGHWQSAAAPQRHVLVGCTVSPGFEWEGFALLDPEDAVAARLRAAGVEPFPSEPAAPRRETGPD